MKRDMELIRRILLHIEAEDELPCAGALGVSEMSINYHLWMLSEAELVGGVAGFEPIQGDFILQQAGFVRLTWEGHEFLDACRDPSTWEKAKRTLADTGRDVGSVTLGVLQALLTKIVSIELEI